MITPRPVALTADDGTGLRGQAWPGGLDWALLIHDVGENEDLDRWRPLIPHLLAQGMSVLAMDLRGHGASDGVWDAAQGIADILLSIAYARQQGARFVALMAPGASALDLLRAAAMTPVDALVLLSPASVAEIASELRGAGEAKLFVVGAADLERRRATDQLQRASIGWALTVSFPTDEQGLDLLAGDWVTHSMEQIQHFIAECRFLATNSRDGVSQGHPARIGGDPSQPERGEQ